MRIPVEQKPSAHRVWPSHALQISAQCALVQEISGVRPTHAVLVLANGQQQQVPYTPELEQHLEDTMQRMRRILEAGEAPGPCWSRGKCAGCGYRRICWSSQTARADGRTAAPLRGHGRATNGHNVRSNISPTDTSTGLRQDLTEIPQELQVPAPPHPIQDLLESRGSTA
jgi:hypothetical protein